MVAENDREISRFADALSQAFGARAARSSRSCPGFDAIAMSLDEAGDRQHVRDAPHAADVLRRPSPTGRFQDNGARWIGDEKAVVIGEISVLVAAAPALP